MKTDFKHQPLELYSLKRSGEHASSTSEKVSVHCNTLHETQVFPHFLPNYTAITKPSTHSHIQKKKHHQKMQLLQTIPPPNSTIHIHPSPTPCYVLLAFFRSLQLCDVWFLVFANSNSGWVPNTMARVLPGIWAGRHGNCSRSYLHKTCIWGGYTYRCFQK